jgi:hypothetical protein
MTMATYPTSPRSAFLAWCQAHGERFVESAAQLGIAPAVALSFKNQASVTAAAEQAQEAAKQAAKAATLTATTEYAELRRLAASVVRNIRAFAELQAKPDAVYALAEIDPIAPRTPTPPPGTPFDLQVRLLTSGALGLKWKCLNPGTVAGVIYEVSRRIGTTGNFVLLGASGIRSFDDATLPAGLGGASSIAYRIVAARSTQRGQPQDFIVNFGVGGGGMSVSAVKQSDMKLAA